MARRRQTFVVALETLGAKVIERRAQVSSRFRADRRLQPRVVSYERASMIYWIARFRSAVEQDQTEQLGDHSEGRFSGQFALAH